MNIQPFSSFRPSMNHTLKSAFVSFSLTILIIFVQHYPLAESLHRRERKANPRYRAFLEKCSQDPRLGKRDLITFISRPVTRLPRLSLQLVEVKKRTERLGDSEGEGGIAATKEDHPDLETIPIVADVLDRFVSWFSGDVRC